MIINHGKHLNMDCIILESDLLKVKILPKLGFKTASIVYKPKEIEFLMQPSKGIYESPQHGDKYDAYDVSGMDEIIPTLEETPYPEGEHKDKIMPDRGDVWSLPWAFEIIDNKVVGSINLPSLPLNFEKTVSFENHNTIRMDYKIKNTSGEKIYYFWALQGLNIFDDETEFIFQEDMDKVINIHSFEDLDSMNLKDLNSYKENTSCKYYIWGKFKKGMVGLDYKKHGMKYIIHYDTEKIPYLGIWVDKTKGKNMYNCAIQPANGFYDSIILSYENNMVASLESYEDKEWTVFIELEEY